jgi:hypothetical protein
MVFQFYGPTFISILNLVDEHLRSMAIALLGLILHLFGDFPSLILMGYLNGAIGMHESMMVNILWLGVGSALYFTCFLITRKELRYLIMNPESPND